MQIDLSNIKNIIFDLGNVLLNLDFDASVKAFQELGLAGNVLDRQQNFVDPVFYNLEVGTVTPAQFRERVREILNNPALTDQQIDDAWYAMIKDVPADRVRVLKELSKKYNVYLFSNTNQIHIERFWADFKTEHGINFPSLFVEDFYSHEIHERKPDVVSFEIIIEKSGVVPAESLFVDDLEKNVLAARESGLKTFWLKEGMEMAEIFGNNSVNTKS